MDPIKPPESAPLSADQQTALKKLHDAATQLESVFVGMLFKQMHADTPDFDIFGKTSNAEKTWNDMLDEKRADAISKTGSFGIAKIVEQQLRASVIGSTQLSAGTTPPSAYAPAPLEPPTASDLP